MCWIDHFIDCEMTKLQKLPGARAKRACYSKWQRAA
jgi:hypothetical protein